MLLVTIGYTNMYSQDSNNLWQFSFGVSAVDLNTDTETEFADFFNVDEDWNVSSGLSMFTLSKYLGDNLSLGLSGSVNSISNFADDHQFLNEVSYFAGDLMLKYSLSEALNCEVMEPYVGVGLGNTWMDSQSWMTANGSLGMNYWFSDIWGLTAQVDYKTGRIKKEDYNQLNNYEKILSEMGYRVKNKIIINTVNELEVIAF